MLPVSGKPLSGNYMRLVLLAAMAAELAGCMSGTKPVAESQSAIIDDVAPGAVATSAAATSNDGTESATGVPSVAMPPVEVPEAALAAFNRSLDMIAAERWDEAELELDLLVLEYPQLPGPYVNLALIYRRDGRDDQAVAMLEQALEQVPGHPQASNELGVILRERGDFERAEAAYRQAIASDPGHALAHYNLAVLLDLYLKRENDALVHYEAYQRLSGDDDPMVELWVADLRRRLGVSAPPPQAAPQLAQENGPRENGQ